MRRSEGGRYVGGGGHRCVGVKGVGTSGRRAPVWTRRSEELGRPKCRREESCSGVSIVRGGDYSGPDTPQVPGVPPTGTPH